MTTTYENFLERVINESIAAAKDDYRSPESAQKLEGSIAGLEACRGKSPIQLESILVNARHVTSEACLLNYKDRWKHRCYEIEVERVVSLITQFIHAITKKTTRRTIEVQGEVHGNL